MQINSGQPKAIVIPHPQPQGGRPLKPDATAVELQPKPELSAKEKLSRAFYTKTEEPWKGLTYCYTAPDEGIENEVRPLTKELFLAFQKMESTQQLRIQHEHYDNFMRDLHAVNPDLAQKNFSYTLGDDAEILILDPKGNLSGEEKEWLTDAINNRTGLKNAIHRHAKAVMTLVDHDTATFGGKYDLSLLNYKDVINYGLINSSKPDSNKDWISQIIDKATIQPNRVVDLYA